MPRIFGQQPSVKERILKLEENGVISGYSTLYDLTKLNRGTTTFILLKTEHCEEFVQFRENAAEVTDLYRISGEYNYLIKVQRAPIEELAGFQDSLVKLGPSKSQTRYFLHSFVFQPPTRFLHRNSVTEVR